MCGEHNLWRKTYAYEGSARVPLIIVPPTNWGHADIELPDELWNIMPTLMPPVRMGKETRAVSHEVVAFQDIMPTILHAADLPIPENIDGESLLPLLLEPVSDWRSYIHGEHCMCYAPEQEMQYITDGKRKYIWFPRIDAEQFFDLEKDPDERHDLSKDPSRIDEIAEWRGVLIKELAQRDCGWVKDGDLYCPPDEPLISPYKSRHWPTSQGPQREEGR
jgi:arylsulfatase A-like enzyme